ncbi:hypothetical protein ACWGID_14955 [Kribbella sp. NPDC054772]
MLTTLAATALLVAVLAAPTGVTTDPPPCRKDVISGQCELQASDDGHDPTEAVTTKPGSKKPGGSDCVYEGQVVPCRTADGFFDAASHCYLTPTESAVTMQGSDWPPGTKFYRCWVILGVVDGKPEGIERFEPVIRPPGEKRTIDPRVAAQQVVKTMTFVAPQLGLSPYVQSANQVGVVNVPIWMWATDPGPTTTGPQTKTAALGGVSITATGTVDHIEWSMGGGNTVTCKGAGTPFTKAMAAGKSLKDMPTSPTCGSRYTKTSHCEKAGNYPVTATAYWNVHWTGGGMQGDIPLNFSRSLPLQVTDLRPVLVDPNGGSATTSIPPRNCGG